MLKIKTSGPASIPLHKGIINNKQIQAQNGMPFKPATMEQGNAFSLGRMAYVRMNTSMSAKPPIVVVVGPKLFGKGGKNYCGASDYTQNKRLIAIGKGKGDRQTSITTSNSGRDTTSVKNALSKTRGGGSVAPKKKGAV